MAELGHPVIGPQSINKLTPGEIRVYAEGLKHRSDQQEEQAHQQGAGSGGPQYNRQSKKRRDSEALRQAEQKANQAYQ